MNARLIFLLASQNLFLAGCATAEKAMMEDVSPTIEYVIERISQKVDSADFNHSTESQKLAGRRQCSHATEDFDRRRIRADGILPHSAVIVEQACSRKVALWTAINFMNLAATQLCVKPPRQGNGKWKDINGLLPNTEFAMADEAANTVTNIEIYVEGNRRCVASVNIRFQLDPQARTIF